MYKRQALKHRLEELGYELEGEALDQVYEAFLNLADKKKEVYDEDLESLVNERDRNESALYALEGVQVSTGFPLTPTATVTLRNAADQVVTACEYGTGPIDAVYKLSLIHICLHRRAGADRRLLPAVLPVHGSLHGHRVVPVRRRGGVGVPLRSRNEAITSSPRLAPSSRRLALSSFRACECAILAGDADEAR